LRTLVVLDSSKRFALEVPGVEIVEARDYLTDPSYRYQNVGYYVSLLGEARGHRPMPSIATIQDLRLQPVIRVASHDLGEQIQRTLKPLRSETFELSVYFGRNLARRYDRLCLALFNQFPAPFLRARFTRRSAWALETVRLIGANEIPAAHRPFVLEQARRYFARGRRAPARRRTARYDLAILRDEQEDLPPSNERALKQFVKAAATLGMRAELIGKESYGRLGEFDGLFIRATTSVNHYTYRFARRAQAEGLVVIDDPESIVRCTNKVYITELMTRHRLRIPRTAIVSEETADLVEQTIGFPCVVKQPDSSFSAGVIKIEDARELDERRAELFAASDLLVAQEFVPTPFDWRVGVLDGEPLFVCRYHMARRHWQIVKRTGRRTYEGAVDALAVDEAPPAVVSLAVRAAGRVGRGLYGVDLKEVRRRPVVIEINDNPNIDAGYEDRVLGGELYLRVMQSFLDRIEVRHR
jgi:glutathione synthase/RimK-type ligase-like ATP-grasp enzyme